MKNFWKRFGEWATASGRDLFASTRFRITALYFFAGLLILLAAGVFTDSYETSFIKHELSIRLSITDPSAISVITGQIVEDLFPIIWLIRLSTIVAMAVAAYVVSGITLRPIWRALESQRRFVSNASHELRTPLAVMKTNFDVALIDKNKLTAKEAVAIMQSGAKKVDQMTNMLQVLLNFSGYENRIGSFNLSLVNLRDVTERIVQFSRTEARKKNISLRLSGESPVVIRGNATALDEMVANLIRNAIAYTPAGGLVLVSVDESGGVPTLVIKDSGIGISPDDLPHIFEPFYRGRNAVIDGEHRGAGLGLAIVREIVRLHRGTITVKSEPKIGTTFSIFFPAFR